MGVYKKILCICFLLLIGTVWAKDVDKMSWEALKAKFEELKKEYYEKTDPFRAGKVSYKGKIRGLFVLIGTKSAGAVYGRVEKVESHPEDEVYHTWIYIKPFHTYKKPVVDSNGYVVVKEGTGTFKDGSNFAIVGRSPFKEGENVIVFLEDTPFRGNTVSLLVSALTTEKMMRRMVEKGKFMPTSEQGYYEVYEAFLVKEDGTLVSKGGGFPGTRGIPSLEKALEQLESVELEYEKAIEEIRNGGGK